MTVKDLIIELLKLDMNTPVVRDPVEGENCMQFTTDLIKTRGAVGR